MFLKAHRSGSIPSVFSILLLNNFHGTLRAFSCGIYSVGLRNEKAVILEFM